MKIATVVGVSFALLALVACARHVVVERDAGRMDGARSITTMSETDWIIREEPAAAEEPDEP